MSFWGSSDARRASRPWRWPAWICRMKHNAKSRNQLETRHAGRPDVAMLRPARGAAVDFLSARKTLRPMATSQRPPAGRLAGLAGFSAAPDQPPLVAAGRGGAGAENHL